MGDHHFTLQVLAAPDEVPEGQSAGRAAAHAERLRRAGAGHPRRYRHDRGARGSGARGGVLGAAAGLTSRCGPRKAPITSRNFAAMAPFHNFPPGRADGQSLGRGAGALSDARAVRHTTSRCTPAIRRMATAGSDAGHTFICGPTGSGKTVLIGFLVAMLARQGATQVVLDKDRGLERLVRALGGEYLTLRNGESPPDSTRCSCPQVPAISSFCAAGCACWPALAAAPRAQCPRAERPGSGAARRPVARPGGAAAVAAAGVPRSDRSGGPACAARALVRGRARAHTRGYSTTPRTPSSGGSMGQAGDRLRCHGVPRQRRRARPGHDVSLSSRAPDARRPAPRLLDG